MSDDYNAGAKHEYEIAELHRLVDQLLREMDGMREQIDQLKVEMRKLQRSRMSNDAALATFEALKHANPSLTLPSFAEQYGLNYEALRKARLRKQKKSGTSPNE